MKFRSLSPLLIVLTLACGSTQIPNLPTQYANVRSSVVFVYNSGGHGSGFVLDAHRVVTARHVVIDDLSWARVRLMGQEYEAVSIWTSENEDVAVITVKETLPVSPVRFAPSPPVVGAGVFAVGYPLDYNIVLSEGIVNQYADIPYFSTRKRLLGISSDVAPGNSGGPVFDSAGRLVGIVLGYDQRARHLYFALDVYTVREEIRKAG